MKMFGFSKRTSTPAAAQQHDCASSAIWQDIARALSQTPRNAPPKGKGAATK
ncbi:hypothetical protein [Devosia sp.]|uniref:hypothetical protein n=1 Tax=Devosia sp. TaxID=1871048 RepID=UPI003264C8D5